MARPRVMSPEETFALIEAYEKYREAEDKGNMWPQIMEHMKENGYEKSMKIYKTKWNSLVINYNRKIKDTRKVNVWPYFKAMDKILGQQERKTEDPKRSKITDFWKPNQK